jgi:hypothetical protein
MLFSAVLMSKPEKAMNTNINESSIVSAKESVILHANGFHVPRQ